MKDLIFHHYETSPFSEKIRLIFGAKKLPWRSVLIPRIMPKPDVVALTGGYRKTPILQVGADIYCDTALIAKYLDSIASTPTLYPKQIAASVLAFSHWADTTLFQIAVAQVFRPENLPHMFSSPAETDAFVKDRQAMRLNATSRRLTRLETVAGTESFLADLDRQFASGARFVAGDELSVADFSVYHCLWFFRRGPATKPLLDPYTHVISWMQRIRDFGHGTRTEMSSSDAIEVARTATPEAVKNPRDALDIKVGEAVEVLPTDYGIDASAGTLVNCSADAITIRRADPRVGEVHVHFPRLSYELRKAQK